MEMAVIEQVGDQFIKESIQTQKFMSTALRRFEMKKGKSFDFTMLDEFIEFLSEFEETDVSLPPDFLKDKRQLMRLLQVVLKKRRFFKPDFKW